MHDSPATSCVRSLADRLVVVVVPTRLCDSHAVTARMRATALVAASRGTGFMPKWWCIARASKREAPRAALGDV